MLQNPESVAMPHLIYRCPRTGMNVQWRQEEELPAPDRKIQSFISVSCPACTQLHLLDNQTGKLLGEK
jgi:hypothetical protein